MALDRLTKIDGGGISTTADYRVGIITATKFVGPIEGDVTGSITATDGTFSGNVTIGGTLTYEDVTNIDSVGIITARSQLNVGNNIKLGNAGVITATSYRGDGSQLTGIVAGLSTISGVVNIANDLDVDGHTNLDNVSVAGVSTFSANANAINANSNTTNAAINVQFSGSTKGSLVPLLDGLEIGVSAGKNLFMHLNQNGGNSSDFIVKSVGSELFKIDSGTIESTFTSTDTGSSAGPVVNLYRNSASPADADYLGQIKFQGESDTGVQRNYAKITGKILDASNGTEDGIIEFAHIKAGSQTITGRWRSDSLQLLNGTALTVAGTSDFTGTSTFVGDVLFDSTSGSDYDMQWTTANGQLRIKDDGKLVFGTSGDVSVYHNDTDFYLWNTKGNSYIQNTGDVYIRTNNNENAIKAIQNGAVELYNDGTKRFETTAQGIDVTGVINSTVAGGNNTLKIETTSSGDPKLQFAAAGSGGHDIEYIRSSNTLNFKQGGGSVRLSITAAGHLLPGIDSQYNIGSSSVRFANIYADTLYGDGSNLTGVTGTTINNNANNRIITGSGTANTLEAETTLEWNGTNTLTSVNQGSGYPDFIFSIKTVAGGGESERFRVGNGPFRIGNTNYSANSYANILVVGSDYNDRGITIVSGNSNEGNIFFGDGGDNDIGKIQYAHSDNSMRFTTNTGERLRIQSDGRVLIGTTTPSGYSNRLLTVAAADGDSSIELRTATDHAGQISFTDGSAGDVTNYRGYIQYNHQGDYMAFGTLSTERARITSSGRFGLGTSSPDHIFEVEDNNSSIAVSRSGANAQLLFKSNSVGQAGQIQVSESSGGGVMLFSTKTTGGTLTERFRIATSGEIGLSGGNYGSSGQVLTSQGSGSAPVWAAASGGKVVNYDSTTVTAAGSASISQGNYSNNIIGLSYAASSSSNKLLLIAMVSFGYQHGQSVASRFTISNNPITGSTGDASGSRRRATTAGYMDSMYQVSNMTLVYEHSSPSTSAVTYGVQLGQSDNGTQTVYWNRSMNDSNHNYRIRAATTLTIIELEG